MSTSAQEAGKIVEAIRKVSQLVAWLRPGPIYRTGPGILDRGTLRGHVLLATLGDDVDPTAIVLRSANVPPTPEHLKGWKNNPRAGRVPPPQPLPSLLDELVAVVGSLGQDPQRDVLKLPLRKRPTPSAPAVSFSLVI